MLELIKLRAQMLSGNVPVDEMKDLKLKATSEIDTGNKILGKVGRRLSAIGREFCSAGEALSVIF
jgi:hypothetical protein